MFEQKDIAAYYDQTEVHYQRFWDLDRSKALHYGIWNHRTKSFKESLLNSNRELARIAKIKPSDNVLDAGCGVGGSAIFLANEYGCEVKGISLSSKQIKKAIQNLRTSGLKHLLSFEKKDYCNTGYVENSFDVIWALESVGSAKDKTTFLKEANRILKNKGRIIVADYFKTSNYSIDTEPAMKSWLNGWAISDIESDESFKAKLEMHGFSKIEIFDFTKEITKSSRRMYLASILGFFGTKAYNLFYDASPFSKIHYKSGIAQYQALRKGLWEYKIFYARKY